MVCRLLRMLEIEVFDGLADVFDVFDFDVGIEWE